jgi:putative spermidine/putrescine transport system permease protein
MESIDTEAIPQRAVPPRLPNNFRLNFDWIGLLPFFAFVAVFLIFPSLSIVIRSVTDAVGNPTWTNVDAMLREPVIAQAYRSTLQVSLITAVSGALFGGLLSWAISLGGLPSWIRGAVLSFSGVAANFAGVPLVFAFVALLGRVGLLNQFLPFESRIDPQTFLYGFLGLCIVYTYFQIPLMVLIITPALDGLRKEWREAAENLGASQSQYWRYVGLPILMPSILGAMALLFANAFSTYVTATALLGAMGQTFAVTIVVANQFRTDTFGNPGLGFALATSMMLVIAVTIMVYTYSRRRAEQWLRRSE